MNADEQAIRRMIQEGSCCSQIMVAMGLRLYGQSNESMVKAASGLCLGLHSGHLCGTLTAAAQVLALFDSRNAADHMIPQLMEWYEETYEETYGGKACIDICGGKLHPARCTDLLIQTWITVKTFLSEFGFEEDESR